MNVRTLGRFALFLAIFLLGALVERSGLLRDLAKYWAEIVYLSQQHIVLVVVSAGLAILTGLPLGIALSRPAMRFVAEPVMQVLNIGTTLPTLAILALSMSFLGIGETPAIFALWVTTLLPIVRNTYVGILAVPGFLLEAARGMGMTAQRILWRVEVPNALWVIFAGIRTAVVINVGTVPLAFLIGGGGLGQLIFTGIDLDEFGMMLAGAIPTAMMAVVADILIGQFAFFAVSRGVNPLR